jgi:hypothetical protein
MALIGLQSLQLGQIESEAATAGWTDRRVDYVWEIINYSLVDSDDVPTAVPYLLLAAGM